MEVKIMIKLMLAGGTENLSTANEAMPFSVVLRGGSGDDAFNVSKAVKNLTIEGGAGTDTIRITQTNFYNQQAFSHFIGGRTDDTTSFVISDFEAGAGGDFLDISPLLLLLDSSYDGNNPFGNYLYLEASGTDSILSVDLDGAIGSEHQKVDVVTLSGVLPGEFVGANFTSEFTIDGLSVQGSDSDLSDLGEAQSVLGSAGNDTISGSIFNDTIHGEGGHDHLSGLAGDDILEGGLGDDTLEGGDGNDDITDRYGRSRIIGDAGDDWIRTAGNNLFADAGEGDDWIELADLSGQSTVSWWCG